MTERGHRLPCPVCIGVMMEELQVGAGPGVEIDMCRRCGGMWLDHGKVQRLRTAGMQATTRHLEQRVGAPVTRCHHCDALLGRDVEHCGECGRANRLDCPVCEREMQGVLHGGLRLDVCRNCKGTWFDRDEIQELWTPRFDKALARRDLTRSDAALLGAETASDLVFHAMFWSPDLLEAGGSMIGGVASGASELLTSAPGLLAALPDVAVGLAEAMSEASVSLFDVITDIIGGIFS